MTTDGHCKSYRDTGSHKIGSVMGFRVKFRVRIRVRAWSGVTLLTLCPCTFCSDPLWMHIED